MLARTRHRDGYPHLRKEFRAARRARRASFVLGSMRGLRAPRRVFRFAPWLWGWMGTDWRARCYQSRFGAIAAGEIGGSALPDHGLAEQFRSHVAHDPQLVRAH